MAFIQESPRQQSNHAHLDSLESELQPKGTLIWFCWRGRYPPTQPKGRLQCGPKSLLQAYELVKMRDEYDRIMKEGGI
jgi:hypothetical protein